MTDPTNRDLADIVASLDLSDAQLAAGDTVPMAPTMQRLRESIERVASKRRSKQHPEAVPHR